MRAFLQFHAVQGGARAVGEVVLSRPLAIASAALPALWGLMMVRGPRRREWEKSLIAVALLARVGYVTFLGRASAEACIDDMLLTGVAILIGAAVDCVYTAPTAADLCVPALALGWLFAAQVWRVLTLQYALLATIALSLVALILTPRRQTRPPPRLRVCLGARRRHHHRRRHPLSATARRCEPPI